MAVDLPFRLPPAIAKVREAPLPFAARARRLLDAPEFILGAFAFSGGQLNCTLTRLPKPIAALNSLELLL